VLTASSHERWTDLQSDDLPLEVDEFLVVCLDELDAQARRRVGLPETLLAIDRRDASPRVILDPDQFEVVVPHVGGGGNTLVYAVATPRRLVVELRGADLELDTLRDRMPWAAEHPSAVALFIIVESVMRSFRDAIHVIRSEIDAIEEGALDNPESSQLARLNSLHRRISLMRRDLGEYADALEDADELLTAGVQLPAVAARLARSHATTVERRLEALSVTRDEVANAMELHRSLTANRQALVINRLTVISVLLLPLTFVTGFFGMNFGWLTERITSAGSFWTLGIAMPIAVGVVLLALMWRAGWLLVLRRAPTATGLATASAERVQPSAERGGRPHS
jgi:magnesium transporter